MSAAPKHVRLIADPRERVVARFMCKVLKNPTTGCWEWQAAKDKDGYGTFQYRGRDNSERPRKERAQRVAYLLFRGEIGDSLVRHSCDNAGCVNPQHLELGDTAQNVADRVTRGRSARGERHGFQRNPERWLAAARRRARVFEWDGAKRTIAEIAALTGVARARITSRIDRGWPIEDAVKGRAVAS